MLKPLVIFLLVLIISTVIIVAEETCTTPDGQTSKCTLLADCPYLLDLTWSEEPEDRSYYLNSRCNETAGEKNETTSSIARSCEVALTERIPEPLIVGSSIIVTGTPSSDFPWFSINIGESTDEHHNGNISVHFSMRQPEQIVVRNTMIRNEWGSEETSSCRPYPFRNGKRFVLRITIEATRALLSINGINFFSYNYRDLSPLSSNWVQVKGVKDAKFKILRRHNRRLETKPTVKEDSSAEVPYKSLVQTFKRDFKNGTVITCEGTPMNNFSTFSIGIGEFGIIREYIKVDMSKQYINHSIKFMEIWGPDDSCPLKDFPIDVYSRFEIQIKVSLDEIKVLVNGRHYCTFAERQFYFYDMNQVYVRGVRDPYITVEVPDQDPNTEPDIPKVCCPPPVMFRSIP